MTNANIRLMVLSVLVGVVAGLAALGFSYACIVIEHFALGVGVGFHLVHPHGEPVIAWLPKLTSTFEPWLLLVVPPDRRPLMRAHRVHIRARGGGPRHRRGDRCLPPSPGRHPPAASH